MGIEGAGIDDADHDPLARHAEIIPDPVGPGVGDAPFHRLNGGFIVGGLGQVDFGHPICHDFKNVGDGSQLGHQVQVAAGHLDHVDDPEGLVVDAGAVQDLHGLSLAGGSELAQALINEPAALRPILDVVGRAQVRHVLQDQPVGRRFHAPAPDGQGLQNLGLHLAQGIEVRDSGTIGGQRRQRADQEPHRQEQCRRPATSSPSPDHHSASLNRSRISPVSNTVLPTCPPFHQPGSTAGAFGDDAGPPTPPGASDRAADRSPPAARRPRGTSPLPAGRRSSAVPHGRGAGSCTLWPRCCHRSGER